MGTTFTPLEWNITSLHINCVCNKFLKLIPLFLTVGRNVYFKYKKNKD